MSSRPTDSAFRRSRSADSKAVFPAGLDVDLGPQPGQAFQAVRASQGLSLPSVCTFSCKARRASEPRADVGLAGRFAVDGVLLGAALLVELRHLLGQLLQPGVGLGLGLGGGSALSSRSCFQPRPCPGPARPWRSAGQALAAGAQRTGLLVDVAALGGQHLDLLLHLGHRIALGIGAAWAARTASSSVGRVQRLFLGLRRPARSACSSAAGDLLGHIVSSSASACFGLAARPIGVFCAVRSASRASARWRPSTT